MHTAFASVRDQLPAAQHGIYFDNAATSPLPRFVRDAVVDSMERRARYGENFFDDAVRRVDEVRGLVGKHLGVDGDGVAFMKNTGEGINHVARSLPIRSGQNVVITALEFASNRFPWMALERNGVELRVVPPDDAGMGVTSEGLAQHVDEDTTIVAVSWVAFGTGYRHDVDAFGKIAHENDAYLLVDGIQGLGAARPPDTRHVDFFANGGHKWLMAPFGVGFLYVRPGLVAELEPDHLGWWSIADWGDYDAKELRLAPTARRFEIGNLGFDVIEGLGAAFRGMPDISAIEKRIRDLTSRLMEGLGPLGRLGTPEEPANRAGIVRFECAAPERVHAALQERGVQASLRSGAVRFSPHYWNSEEEVDAVVDTVRSVVAATA